MPCTLTLNIGQQSALETLASGENVFLSGEAGTGKTATVNSHLDTLSKAELRGVAVTATTGVAAQLLGGSTIHSHTDTGAPPESLSRNAP